ncbi:MAG: hypothetical protein AAFX46_00140 [Cyanobacteria bacterium J06636_27]
MTVRRIFVGWVRRTEVYNYQPEMKLRRNPTFYLRKNFYDDIALSTILVLGYDAM